LIRLDDLDFMCSDVWSAGVVFYRDEILLLITIEDLSGHQSIHLAKRDEKNRFHVEEKPFLEACRDDSGCNPHESHGIMDAKVTLIGDTYYIMYLASGEYGFRLGLATTKDFEHVDMRKYISQPDTKAGTLFPEKIKGRYARLDRPRAGTSIWITYSDDLTYWGGSECVMRPRAGFWDSARIGAGTPPMRIPQGWLLIYYAVKNTSAGPLFRLGAVILEIEEPTKIVARSNIPILSPREHYERVGNIGNMVFTSGALIKNDGEVEIIYSGSSSCLCLGTTTVREIVDTCSRSTEAF